jgi:hemolysin activation/secretion protein
MRASLGITLGIANIADRMSALPGAALPGGVANSRLRFGWRVLLCWLPVAASLAQEVPPISSLPGGQRGATGPASMETLPVEPAPSPAPPDAGPAPVPPGGPGFVLQGVRFEGGETLPGAGLKEIVTPFVGQWMTLADVEELRYRLTKHYVDQGYINSGVVLKPDQVVRDGVIVFQIVPGQLAEIRVSGQGRLRPAYVTGRLQPDASAPFNRLELQERFQLLLQDPLIDQIKGTLLPGPAPGSAVLDLTVTRARPWDLYLRTDNYRPPSTGAERAYVGGAVRNLTGFGDALDLYVGRGYAGDGNEGALGWSIPLNARDTRLSLRYDRSDASLLEEPLADLEIESETQRVDLGVSHPLWRSLQSSLKLGALLSWSENKTSLLGEPFSFSEGVVEGESRVAAVRFFQEYSRHSSRQAYALRSVFSAGLDAFDATIHPYGAPDSQFFAWLGQGQYVLRLTERGAQLILRGGLQLADNRLLPQEQFAIGGVNTVRGYRENELVGDRGYAASLEMRYPLWEGIGFAETKHLIQLAVFTDVGSAWNHGQRGEREDLWSIGAGVLWTIEERLRAELYLGHALNEPVPQEDYDWQDDGVHFMVQVDF